MRFWLAPHLAFLLQWLRILGFRVRLWRKGMDGWDREDAVIQWERYPLPVSGVRVISLSAAEPGALLKELYDRLNWVPDRTRMFKRCLRCGSRLTPLNPEQAFLKWPLVPPYVLQTQHHFNWCESCRKLYWAGTHVQRMVKTLENWGVIPRSPSDRP
jgi:uncharacterized protein with PIN domain